MQLILIHPDKILQSANRGGNLFQLKALSSVLNPLGSYVGIPVVLKAGSLVVQQLLQVQQCFSGILVRLKLPHFFQSL